VELAKGRGRIAMAEEASRKAAEAAARDLQNDAVSKASEWELKWKAADPDYAQKEKRVLDKINLAFFRRGQSNSGPLTSKEVVEICENARIETDEEIAALLPKPKEVRSDMPRTPMTVRSNPEPTTMLEAMQLVGG
jgi:hypothetical protein